MLIFCLEDLFNGDSGVLKSPTDIAVHLFLDILQEFFGGFFFMYLGASVLVYLCLPKLFLFVGLLPLVLWGGLPYRFFFLPFTLRNNLSDISIATPAFLFFISIHLKILFPSLHSQSMCVFFFWCRFLVDSKYMGHVFLYNPLHHVFW